MARAAGCVPRILADDLLLLYVGPVLSVFTEAFEATHEFLIDMGAKVAPTSLTFFQRFLISDIFRDQLDIFQKFQDPERMRLSIRV